MVAGAVLASCSRRRTPGCAHTAHLLWTAKDMSGLTPLAGSRLEAVPGTRDAADSAGGPGEWEGSWWQAD